MIALLGPMKTATRVKSRKLSVTSVRSRPARMPLHSYVVEHDKGFAPNPFHGVCTLACCKPKIRKYAVRGEYVIGTGTKKRGLQGRLTYVMQIKDINTFDKYWGDRSFARK